MSTTIRRARLLQARCGTRWAWRSRSSSGAGTTRRSGRIPCGSYQIAFAPELFASLVPWLALNRGDLTVFVHPNTGDALADHSAHVIWLGESRALNLDALR